MAWKNGEKLPPLSKKTFSAANSIVLAGKDIYIVGNDFDATSNIATLWINGKKTVPNLSTAWSSANGLTVVRCQ